MVLLLIVYAVYVFGFQVEVQNYSDVIVAIVFFFTLFSGFFITRQNDRYSNIGDQVSTDAGWFSFLYRTAGSVPRVQKEVREIIREHYQKIVFHDDWAYHIKNPSNTISSLTKSFSSITKKEMSKVVIDSGLAFAFEVLANLQVSRKKTLGLDKQKLSFSQWLLIYILTVLLMISFNFIPVHTLGMDILKVFFGVAVILVIILLQQLDNLTLFGKNFNRNMANDIFWILDEKDAEAIKRKKKKKK